MAADATNLEIRTGDGNDHADGLPFPHPVQIFDEDGNDSLQGSAGNFYGDMLVGWAGDDLFWGSSGDDLYYGGGGSDTVQYSTLSPVALDFSLDGEVNDVVYYAPDGVPQSASD